MDRNHSLRKIKRRERKYERNNFGSQIFQSFHYPASIIGSRLDNTSKLNVNCNSRFVNRYFNKVKLIPSSRKKTFQFLQSMKK